MALIVVSGAIANKAFNGGEAWVRLNWTLGLKQLGHEVLFVEQIGTPAESEVEDGDRSTQLAGRIQYFQSVMTRFGLEHQAALLDNHGRCVWGVKRSDVADRVRRAAALINISGHLQLPWLIEPIPRKAYIDLDPGFTQFWHEQGTLGARLEGHDYYFSVGANIGAPDCSIPTNGLSWRPVRQPVVLRLFPVTEVAGPWRFTTIGSWRGSFGPVEAGGKTYGQKVHEFRKFIDLPRLVDPAFEVALDIHPAEENDLALLRSNHWRLVDPHLAAGDPFRFRRYVQQSAAEFSVAQGMYVDTNSGWFSDRTVRYLASGKPVLVQDTGFTRNLPAGEGLFAFRSMDNAIDGVHAIASNYPAECRGARRIAEQYFDSDQVLSNLLEQIDVGTPRLETSQALHDVGGRALP